MRIFGKWENLIKLIFSSNGKDITVNPPASPGENQTFNLPDLNTSDTHTLVTETLAQALTNKTLGSTNNISGATATSLTNSGTLTFPSGTDTIVSRNSSDTLTNKTIDGDDNTVQDLGLGVFKTSAPDAYKLLQRTSTGAVDEAGTDAVLLPSGSVGQRPTGSAGMFRYNSDTNLPEFFTGSVWSALSSQAQLLHVAKSGAPYTSIQTAINAISDASSSKPYVIRIAPGVYTEDVTLKDWVFLENGIMGSVKIVGRVTATGLSGTSGIKGVTLEFTPTTGGQSVLNQSGGTFVLLDTDIYLVGTADFAVTGASLSSGTALTIFNSTVWDRRSGSITQNFVGWSFAGSGTYGIFNASCSARGAYSSGTHCLVSLSQTGSFTMSGGALIWGNTAAFSGTVRGICVTSSSASPRITSGVQVRLSGTSGGTGVGLRLAAGGDDFQHVGTIVFIDGFASEYTTDTGSGDTQKVWLNSVNKDLGKTGAGIAVVTPYDEQKSGFVSFAGEPSEGSTTFWSWAAPNLTVSLAGAGVVKGAPVTWAAGQSVALTDLATNYVYMNSAGVIGVTSSGTESLFLNNIVLLECWRDGSNLIVTKENHPYKFTTSISHAWHRLFGVLLEGTGAQIAQFGVAGNRQIEVQGNDVLTDHGLDTTVPASGGAITMNFVYTGTAGAARFFSSADVFPDAVDTGTSTTTVGSNKWVVHRVGVTKSNLNAATPQYISVIPTTEYNSLAAAQAAISAGSIQPFPSEIKELETAQLGYVILYKNAGGSSFSIVSVIVEKQTFTARFLGSTPATQAALITVDATAYSDADAVLSSTDVTAQAAFDTIYAKAVKQSATIDTAEADGVPRYTSTDGRSIGVATTPMKQSATGVVTVQNTTDATNKDSGALIVEGGVGIEKKLFVGTDMSAQRMGLASGGTAASTYLTLSTTTWQFGGTNSTITEAGTGYFAQALQLGTSGTAGAGLITRSGTTWQFGGTSSTITDAGTASFATKLQTPTLAPVAANGVMTIDSTSAIIIPKGTTAERPTPAEGQFRYNSTEKKLEVYNGTNWVAAGAGASIIQISYTGTLAIGTPMYLNGSTWAKADCTTGAAAEVVGVISKVVTVDTTFELTTGGEIIDIPDAQITDYSSAATGSALFLGATAGTMVVTEPTTVGYVSKPLGVLILKSTGANKMVLVNMRGSTVGGTNLYTSIGLANAATTTIQNVSAHTAGTGGFIEGYIQINADTDYVATFKCQFHKPITGTAYTVTVSYGGDALPAGTVIDITTGGLIQVTLPSILATGGFSAQAVFAMQAAAVGAQLPLSISPALISGAADITCQSGYGINFGNETLKNYDEGTWTPSITFGGASVGVTYDTSRYGHYTRIGNRCFFNCFFILTSKGSSVGQARITGLPFTSATTANGGYSAAALQANGLSGTNYSMCCYVNQNATTMDLYMIPTNSNAGAGTVAGESQVSNTAQFMISGSYVIA